jgi:hypothetical protein
MKRGERRGYEVSPNVGEVTTVRPPLAGHVIRVERCVRKMEDRIEEYPFIADLQP